MQFLGDLYMNGHGVPQSSTEAIGWYLAAAADQYAPAMHKLGGKGSPNSSKSS